MNNTDCIPRSRLMKPVRIQTEEIIQGEKQEWNNCSGGVRDPGNILIFTDGKQELLWTSVFQLLMTVTKSGISWLNLQIFEHNGRSHVETTKGQAKQTTVHKWYVSKCPYIKWNAWSHMNIHTERYLKTVLYIPVNKSPSTH